MLLRFLLPLYFLSFFGSLLAAPPQKEWDKRVLENANTAKNENYLTEEEKKVVYYINLVRLNPQLFSETILQHYLDSVKLKNNKWVSTLKKDLKNAAPMDIVLPQQDLYEFAKFHAQDMGKSGKIGHLTASGLPYPKRIENLKKKYQMIYENCQYGYADALSIVIDLLIDEGVEDFGHRKTLLNPTLKYVGTSIQHHKKYKHNCVMDFGTDLKLQ